MKTTPEQLNRIAAAMLDELAASPTAQRREQRAAQVAAHERSRVAQERIARIDPTIVAWGAVVMWRLLREEQHETRN